MSRATCLLIGGLLCASLCGCGSGFGIAAAAGFVGTVMGNLGSDTIEGKWYPGKPVKEEKKDD